MRIKLIFPALLLLVSCNSWSLSRIGPPPTLYDFADQAELVFIGRVSSLNSIHVSFTSRENLPLQRVEFADARYIDGEGIHAFDKPVYLYLYGLVGPTQIGEQLIFLLNRIDTKPSPVLQLAVQNDDSIEYQRQWEKSGTVQEIGPLGEIVIRTPFHSCRVLNPLFEVKQYECQYGNEIITTLQPEDTEPPIDLDGLLNLLIDYQAGTTSYTLGDLSILTDPDRAPELIRQDLAQMESSDKIFIEMLNAVALPEKLLDLINERERARGNPGDHKNAPEIVTKTNALVAERQLKHEAEQREYEAMEAQKLAERKAMQQQHEAEFNQHRQNEIALEGEPIRLIQSDASLSPDISTLPGCSQLWHSPDMPLKNDSYYIGNCVQVQHKSVCTYLADAKQANDNCMPVSLYVGGIITPPIEAFQNPDSPWMPEEMQVLHYGAGMSSERLAVVRQPLNPPPLFIGTQPTRWNLYLRQVKTIPDFVPDALRD